MAPLSDDTTSRKRRRYDSVAEMHVLDRHTGRSSLSDDEDEDEAHISVSAANKRVCFALSNNGNGSSSSSSCTSSPNSSQSSSASLFGDKHIATQVFESPREYEDIEKEELWWTRHERSEFTGDSRKLARGFKKQHKESVDYLLRVFEECSKTPSDSSNEFLEKVTLGVPTQVRGLECGFIPSVKAWRRKHALEVLDTQKQLQKGRLSEAMCLQVLSSRAMRSSRPSRIMARLIGEADARP